MARGVAGPALRCAALRDPNHRMQLAAMLHDRINRHGAVLLHPEMLPGLHLALVAIAEVRGALGRGSMGRCRVPCYGVAER